MDPFVPSTHPEIEGLGAVLLAKVTGAGVSWADPIASSSDWTPLNASVPASASYTHFCAGHAALVGFVVSTGTLLNPCCCCPAVRQFWPHMML